MTETRFTSDSMEIAKFHPDGTIEFSDQLTPKEGSEKAWELLKEMADRHNALSRAAPELYEALLITMQRLDSANHDSFDGVWPTEEDFEKETKEARAALAKARGEQS